jgi:ubiquinone/menaquinone biosynthesis C-methylase UbiE
MSLETTGQVIANPRFYELILWLITKGKELTFRSRIAEIAGIKQGEFVLDAGCGTGTMLVLAKKIVGNEGKVCGFEPSENMIKFARNKANKSGSEIELRQGVIEKIEYPDNAFDVALCIVFYTICQVMQK